MDFSILTPKTLLNIGIMLTIIIVSKILSPVISYVIVKMFHFKEKNKENLKRSAFYKPIKNIILVIGFYIAFKIIYIPENISFIILKAFRICIIVFISKGFANLFDPTTESYENIKRKFNFTGNDTLINFFSKILKIIIYIISGFIIVSELGYDLNGLATGLGVFSVVIALAAQDLAKSILGGIAIIVDKPFELGDSIETNSYTGTVEDITFRTTRIRNANNQIVIIPNSKISDSTIVNYSRREKMKYELCITLNLSTTLEKIKQLTDQIKLCLSTHNNIEKESIKVFFNTISNNGIELSISFYTDLHTDFTEFKESINYTILEIIREMNIELAYNSQSIYLKKD